MLVGSCYVQDIHFHGHLLVGSAIKTLLPLNVINCVHVNRGPFLESPDTFSGPELYFKIKIYRMVV